MTRPVEPPNDPTSGKGSFNPPSNNQGSVANSPQLLTSTGGLSGSIGALLCPVFNTVTRKASVLLFDSNDFNCEDDCEYDFRQEANYGQLPGEGRICTINRLVIKYRELDRSQYFINVTVYQKAPVDDFVTMSVTVDVPQLPFTKFTKERKRSFPDKRIHTIIIPTKAITGERPQVTIIRKGSSGPMCVTKVILCGTADENSAG